MEVVSPKNSGIHPDDGSICFGGIRYFKNLSGAIDCHKQPISVFHQMVDEFLIRLLVIWGKGLPVDETNMGKIIF